MTISLDEHKDRIIEASAFVDDLTHEISKVIVGQNKIIDRLIIALLCNGHVLLEGLPGLAKTLTCKTLSTAISASFSRIQFTPDLLPSDVVGTLIYDMKNQTFVPKKGPIFANFVLADEINRAPAKVQSALLEAMQERQVTIGDATYPLGSPFIVLATQNPIEQEGTYALPEAQVDRFLFKLQVGYPTREEEHHILDRMSTASLRPGSVKDPASQIKAVVTPEAIQHARTLLDDIYLDEKVKHYILDLVGATRSPNSFNIKFTSSQTNQQVSSVIEVGASPRATLALALAGKANAFIRHRAHVTPDDIKAIGPDVLRHRIHLTYEAEAEEITTNTVIRQLFEQIEVP
ncbi:MAG: AAA family ATPase [Sumerlaeia bacterium]